MREEVKVMIKDLLPFKERMARYSSAVMPRTRWK
jgi:hypothetical protein